MKRGDEFSRFLADSINVVVLLYSIWIWFLLAGATFTVSERDDWRFVSFSEWISYPMVMGAFLGFVKGKLSGILILLCAVPATWYLHAVWARYGGPELARSYLVPMLICAAALYFKGWLVKEQCILKQLARG